MRRERCQGLSGRASTAALFAMLVAAGCDSSATAPRGMAATASAVRADRRAYDGAPPVIPHPPLKISCIACHTETGKEMPPLGWAPANPHAATAGLSHTSNCRQCHVFRHQEQVFAESDFAGLRQQLTEADRLYRGAPPVIPHRVFMRENCNSCHSGQTARPEIRCTHAQRTNCRQCHVPGVTTSPQPTLATADTSPTAP